MTTSSSASRISCRCRPFSERLLCFFIFNLLSNALCELCPSSTETRLCERYQSTLAKHMNHYSIENTQCDNGNRIWKESELCDDRFIRRFCRRDAYRAVVCNSSPARAPTCELVPCVVRRLAPRTSERFHPNP